MNFYPIYKNKKLLPWIKWWLIKGNKIAPKHLSEWINSASAITLTGVYKGSPLLNLNLNGNTSQTEVPSPEAPVPVNVVKGNNTIKINDTDYQINLKSKNLFDCYASFNYRYNTTTLNIEGNTLTTTNVNSNAGYIWWHIPVENNKSYTIAYGSMIEETESSYNRVWYQESDTIVSTYTQVNATVLDKISKYATLTASKKYLIIGIRVLGNSYNSISDIQLEQSSEPTPYEPYYDYELCKIGDYQDVIYKQNNKYYVEKKIRSLNLAISDMNNNNDYPGWTDQTQLKLDYPYKNGTLSSYCNFLCNIQQPNVAGLSINTNASGILFLSKAIYNLTQDEWKTNYPNLVVNIYYNLATSEVSEITESNLINQLEAIYNAKLQSGTNEITQTPSDLPFYLNFQYYEKG